MHDHKPGRSCLPGGHVAENYLAVQRGLDPSREDVVRLARNSIEASFIDAAAKRA